MSRQPHRILVLALLALTFLLPTLATAQPHPREAVAAVITRHDAGPSFLARLESLFSVLWKNGSGLEPDGRPGPITTTAGDNGSILEPDGRH